MTHCLSSQITNVLLIFSLSGSIFDKVTSCEIQWVTVCAVVHSVYVVVVGMEYSVDPGIGYGPWVELSIM